MHDFTPQRYHNTHWQRKHENKWVNVDEPYADPAIIKGCRIVWCVWEGGLDDTLIPLFFGTQKAAWDWINRMAKKHNDLWEKYTTDEDDLDPRPGYDKALERLNGEEGIWADSIIKTDDCVVWYEVLE